MTPRLEQAREDAQAWLNGARRDRHEGETHHPIDAPIQAVEELLAALREAETPPPPQTWQPIETAPKDGTLVLLGNADDPDWPLRCRRWEGGHWRGYDADEATHWMSLAVITAMLINTAMIDNSPVARAETPPPPQCPACLKRHEPTPICGGEAAPIILRLTTEDGSYHQHAGEPLGRKDGECPMCGEGAER